MNFIREKAKKFKYLLIAASLLQLLSCSHTSKEAKFHTIKPDFGPWTLLKVKTFALTEVSEPKKPNKELILKDSLVFKNQIAINNIAYNLEYLDAFAQKSTSPLNSGGEVAYLLRGSPCMNCDRIQSLYLVNPARGGSKIIFWPGKYFHYSNAQNKEAKKEQISQQLTKSLEFYGRVFYGNCLTLENRQSKNFQLYLYSESYGQNQSITQRKLIRVNPFTTGYRTEMIQLNLIDSILDQVQNTIECIELPGKNFVMPS